MVEDPYEGVDPTRLAARGEARQTVDEAFLDNDVRLVEVGNNLYPTSWRAEQYGVTEEQLAESFWQALNLDYHALEVRGRQIKDALEHASEVHVTTADGTDIIMQVQGREVFVSDGTISDDELQRGGPAVGVYLPAGEVFTTPVPGTANGRVVDRRTYFRGKQIDNLTLNVEQGRVTSLSGSGPGYDEFKALYDAVQDPRKELLGVVDLGINENVHQAADTEMSSWVPAGTLTIGIGNNQWAGGDNDVAFAFPVFLSGATVTFDGETIVDDGELRL